MKNLNIQTIYNRYGKTEFNDLPALAGKSLNS
jgi:hypothetical protein